MESFIGLILLVAWVVLPKLLKNAQNEGNNDVDELLPAAPPPQRSGGRARIRAQRPRAAKALDVRDLVAKVLTVKAEAKVLARDARVSRPTYRFVEPLERYVVPMADALSRDLAKAGPTTCTVELEQRVQGLELVAGQIESFVVQRRDTTLQRTLGDADTFAHACYSPIVEFARAHGVPLTSNIPVTEFGYDLSIWIAFIPTGIAPIALPPSFFGTMAWWPALAHEIGHDFYHSVQGFDGALREALELPTAEVGAMPLRIEGRGLDFDELVRVFGGWVEELFCDVFGTLMCGPAYGWTLVELFGEPDTPATIARVHSRQDGRGYDEHPPRHLRLLAVCEILRHIGCDAEAHEIREAWTELHDGDPVSIWFPVGHSVMRIPTEPLAELAEHFARKVHECQLPLLSTYRLHEIPGLDFGPHLKQESQRVCDSLLAGRAPSCRAARALVSGAVLAYLSEPDREVEFIALAREAIVAFDSLEIAPDAYQPSELETAPQDPSAAARDAFILQTILGPARSRSGWTARQGDGGRVTL